MTNPHATLDVSSPIFLPLEAETSEVIQKEGIRHTLGSILLAPFSFLFLLLLRSFNATVRCSLLPAAPPPPLLQHLLMKVVSVSSSAKNQQVLEK